MLRSRSTATSAAGSVPPGTVSLSIDPDSIGKPKCQNFLNIKLLSMFNIYLYLGPFYSRSGRVDKYNDPKRNAADG